MQDLHPSGKYGEDEMAYRDDWVANKGRAYTGKFTKNRHGQIVSTEILTTGIQRLHANPIEFQANDPEFFDFVINTLQHP